MYCSQFHAAVAAIAPEPSAVLHDKAFVQLLDRPGRREAALRHPGSLAMFTAMRHARDGRAAIGASSGHELKAGICLSENPHCV